MPSAIQAQPSGLPNTPQPNSSAQESGGGKHRILWVIPNYRAEENAESAKPLFPGGKFKIALYDSFDPSAFLVAGFYAGLAMAQNQHRGYGEGAEGFGRYYGAAFGDQGIGNFMTEAILPSAFHQDPRYFTKRSGGFWSRAGYAVSREVITRGDNGGSQFNISEIGGTAVAGAIANAYYPDEERTAGKAAVRWGTTIGLNASYNLLKEFWPDVRRKLFH